MNAAFDKLAPRFVGSASVWLRYVLPNRKARKGETAKTAMSAVYCFDEEGKFLRGGLDSSVLPPSKNDV